MKKPIWKQLWFLFSAPLALILCLLVILFFRDIEPVQPAKLLRYNYVKVVDEDNCYSELQAADSEIDRLKDLLEQAKIASKPKGKVQSKFHAKVSMSRSSSSINDEINQAYVDDWLINQESELSPLYLDFRQAIQEKKYYLSNELKSIADVLPNLGALRSFYLYESQLMQAYARRGDWQVVTGQIELLSTLYNKPMQINSLIEGLVFTACRGIQMKAINAMFDEHVIPEYVLDAMLSVFEEGRSWQSLHNQSYVGELYFMKMLSEGFSKPISKSWFPSNQDQLLICTMRKNLFYKDCFPFFEYALKHVETPTIKLPKMNPWKKLASVQNDYWYLFIHREALILNMVIPSIDTATKKFRQLSWKEGLLQLRVACLLYELEKGALPESLNALVPSYLNEVPLDIYTGKEIFYDRNKGLIYLVGPDLKDDGGVYDKERMRKLDYKGDIVQFIHGFPEEDK